MPPSRDLLTKQLNEALVQVLPSNRVLRKVDLFGLQGVLISSIYIPGVSGDDAQATVCDSCGVLNKAGVFCAGIILE